MKAPRARLVSISAPIDRDRLHEEVRGSAKRKSESLVQKIFRRVSWDSRTASRRAMTISLEKQGGMKIAVQQPSLEKNDK